MLTVMVQSIAEMQPRAHKVKALVLPMAGCEFMMTRAYVQEMGEA